MTNWKYYNHALIPATPPHEPAVTDDLAKKTIWESCGGGYPLLARWTSEFDCGYHTEWWYCIKDTPLDIQGLPSKRRYELNKGYRYFSVRRINPTAYAEEILSVAKSAFSAYPVHSRPVIKDEQFKRDLDRWTDKTVFGAFYRETGRLTGYAVLTEYDSHVDFEIQKTSPDFEKYAVNAALVRAVCEYYDTRLSTGYYINDGERNILHVTAFPEYLEKYFGFRKAYCRLHIRYRKGIGLAVKALMPFRSIFRKYNCGKIGHKINGLLMMEEICRQQEKEYGRT